MRGKFITVEGGEGAGKSSLIAGLREQLAAADIPVLVSREPGGTQLGEAVREILLDNHQHKMVAEAELLLMFAARVQHLREKIEPALAVGTWVVCDRFTDATYAYQGYGRELDLRRIAWLESWLQGELRPDLTLLLDVPVATGLTRATGRHGPDRFEAAGSAFLQRVRIGYLALAERESERYRVIDASQSRTKVQEQLRATLVEYIKSLGY